MKHHIGFRMKTNGDNAVTDIKEAPSVKRDGAVKSVVQVKFYSRGITLSYYNDSFDLRRGDIVYVEGKLEGERGLVVDVSYSFKIKLSQYKRIIALVDTEVHGELFMIGSHFLSFDRTAIPKKKILSWFKAPTEEAVYVSGNGDGTSFSLDNLERFDFEVAERGREYYLENRVSYVCLDGSEGYAIVSGSDAYEVEFRYEDGMISNVTCSCFCMRNCKHSFAALLQLREVLQKIEGRFSKEYGDAGYFAAISKETLIDFAVSFKDEGMLIL